MHWLWAVAKERGRCDYGGGQSRTFQRRAISPPTSSSAAAAATDAGTIVVVDESYASYLGPPESAAALTLEAPNLLVLRSVSKGYCAGGLRVGYVVASALAESGRD